MIRASVLETLDEEYVRTARAKGAGEFKVLRTHVLRNAMLPVVTMIGMDIGTALGGVIFIESVFGLPGLGGMLRGAIPSKDLPVILGVVTFTTFGILLLNLVIDLAYGFIDPRVRQALTRSIDVDRAVLFTLRGTGIPAYGPVPPGVEAYDASLKRAPYQLDAARKLLAEAGVASGFRASLAFNAGWGYFAELAQTIRADLAKVGVIVDFVPASGWKELVADIREGRGDMFIYNWLIPLADADAWLTPMFKTKSVDNLTRYSSLAVDRLLEQAQATVEDTARLDLYRRAQQTVIDDAPMIFLFHEVRVSAHHTRVIGLELNAQSYPTDRFARIDLKAE